MPASPAYPPALTSTAPSAGSTSGDDAYSELQAQAESEVRSLTVEIQDGRAGSDTYELRASYLIELGRLNEAEADLENVTNATQRDSLQASIATARGALQEACDLYEGILASDPARSGIARKLARLYVQQGTFQPDQIKFVRDTLETQFDRLGGTSDWVPWIRFLHDRYSAAGHWDLELGMLRRVAEKSPLPSNPRLALWMADALIAVGSVEEAAALILELSLASGHEAVIRAYRHTARALVRHGDYEQAAGLYTQLADATAAPDAIRMAEILPRAAVGQRFVPLERVGTGAAAEVWKTFDLYTGRHVGWKILHESLTSDPTATIELRREYEVMAASLCPRLARVIAGTFEHDRFAMDLLDYSLVDLLNDSANLQGMPLQRAIRIVQEVAEGIDYIHARGFVYQDLSPQNILFKADSVKLCDLGGLKEQSSAFTEPTVYASAEGDTISAERFSAVGSGPLDGDAFAGDSSAWDASDGAAPAGDVPAPESPQSAEQVRAALTVAKVAYASPEQCALLLGNRAGIIDRRSDIYSLGVVLYQMVTGRLPFEGPDQAVLHAHLYATPIAPIIHRPSLGQELNRIILRCMDRDPEQRFATAGELWEELEAAPTDE